MEQPRLRWSSLTKVAVSLLLVGLAVYLIFRFDLVIKPLILAMVLAYILSPVASFLQQRLQLRRGLATLLTYLLLIVIVVAIPMVVVPPLVTQSRELNVDIQQFLNQVETLLAKQYMIAGRLIDISAVFRQAVGSVQGILEPFIGQSLNFAIEVISSLIWVVFVIVVSFYLIKDGQSLNDWLGRLVPPLYRPDFLRLRDEINRIWSAFFRGQLVLALIVATIITIFGLLLGLPFALPMGVLAGLLELLPSIGHGIWLTIASLLAFFVGSNRLPLPNWAFLLLLIGLHLIFQQFDLNYLIPRVIGRRVHLHPLVVILGIVLGAVFAGVLGIFLAAPVIASARVLGGYIYANLLDMDPFPEEVAPPLPPPNPRWWKRNKAKSGA